MSNTTRQEPYAVNRRAFLKQGSALAAASLAVGAAAQERKEKPMLRVAMLSGWHAHAKGYAKAVQGMDDADITLVWDEDPERGKAWAEELGVPFEPNLDAVLRRDDVDGVVVDAPTNQHAEIMVAAADAGKHIFTEKVMAPTVEECERIAEAVRRANVVFTISFPYRCRPEVLYAHKALQDGLLGQLSFLRARVAHNAGSANWLPPHFWNKEQTGGGAMMDLGAHPMYLARWFGGQPVRIASVFTYMTDHEVEDNAVSVIEFEGEVLGSSETSFMSTHSPFSLELSGTEGGLFVGGPDGTVRIRSNKMGGDAWTTPESLPPALPPPIRQWADAVLYGKEVLFGLEEGIQLTELMEYAYRSHEEGKKVDIPRRAKGEVTS